MIQKEKKSLFLIFCISLVVVVSAGAIYAINLLNVVPQNIGLKDVQFKDLNRPYCENCHGDSLADTHHQTKNAVSGNCVFCHGVMKKAEKTGVELKTNCMLCHTKSPHHQTEAAINKECTSCHESPGVSDYSTAEPKYKISMITPTKKVCGKCHRDGEVNGEKVYGFKKTHHGIQLKGGCGTCHTNDKATLNIRVCERCHSVKAIHEVKPHVEKNVCIHCHDVKEGAAFVKSLQK